MTLDELLAVYGNPHDPKFESTQLAIFQLPYAMTFGAGEGAALLTRARCHRLAREKFLAALQAIKDADLEEEAAEYNGIVQYRSIRGFAGHLSAHAWGLAIDLNASRFPLGSTKEQHPGVLKAFADAGFVWGGSFQSRKDPMHWTLCGF